MWLPLYPFNIYNIQNPKTHTSQKGNYKKFMKNKVSQQQKTWLPLYPFNIYNIQNPKNTCSQKGKKKRSQFPFFNSRSTSRSVLALNIADSKVLVNYKVLDLQVLFPSLQESSQSDIGVKIYDQSTKTGHKISMSRFFPTLVQANFSLSFYVSTHL